MFDGIFSGSPITNLLTSLKKNYLFLAVLGLCCCEGFSLVVVMGLLSAVASLVVGLVGAWASVIVACGLSCSTTCGIFQAQEYGSNPCLLQILHH